MDTQTGQLFLTAVRGCGLYSPDQVAAAGRAVAAPGNDPLAVADRLQAAGLLTPYQYRKVRYGRAADLLFGPYLILDKIGEGGMGKVYRAAHGTTGMVVALKIVRPNLIGNKVVLARYKREARAAAALSHPNIVALYEDDEVNGRYYLAMEYVDGIDLARLMRAFGNPPAAGLPQYQEAAEYARQAALGLHHAHGRGLVHRDIKPSNLLVHGDRALPGTTGTAVVKVLDMGLVRRAFDEGEPAQTELTRDGTVVGTPDYMAPEQAKNSSTVDARADLYSLGCALYFLLRGQPPFPDGSPIDKLIRHQLDPPPDVRRARPDVPKGLAEVVDRLLKKNPDDRFQSAAAVAEALAPFTPGGAGAHAGRRDPGHEPFDLAAGPGAVVGSPAPPARDRAPPVVLDAEVVAHSPAGGPSGRVRVAARPAAKPGGQASGRLPAATAIPRPDPAPPSSDSLPGTGRSGPKSTLAADSTPPGSGRRPRPGRPGRQGGGGRPNALLIAAGVGIAVMAVVTVGVAVFGGLFKSAPPSPTGKDGDGKGAPKPAPLKARAPAGGFLPAGTVAAAVAAPRADWPRAADRATLAVADPGGPAAGIVEGRS